MDYAAMLSSARLTAGVQLRRLFLGALGGADWDRCQFHRSTLLTEIVLPPGTLASVSNCSTMAPKSASQSGTLICVAKQRKSGQKREGGLSGFDDERFGPTNGRSQRGSAVCRSLPVTHIAAARTSL